MEYILGGKKFMSSLFYANEIAFAIRRVHESHQMCTTVYAFCLNMGKERRQCLDIGIKTWQVHEHSSLFFYCVIYLLFFRI